MNESWFLEVQHPDGHTNVVPLEKELTRIGRAADNDVLINDLSISRWHASITLEPAGSPVLHDLKSANGVLLNGQRINEAAMLRPEDRIHLGQFRLVVRAKDNAAPFTIQTVAIDLEQLHDHPELLAAPVTGQSEASTHLRSLELLYEVGMTLTKGRSIDDVTSLAVNLLFRIEQVTRAAVLLWNEPGGAFENSRIHLRSGDDRKRWTGEYDPQNLVMSRTILQRVRQENRPLLVRDAKADAGLVGAASIVRAGIQAAFCAPLFSQGKFLGVLYADNLIERDAFSDDDFRTFSAVAAQTALALGNALANKELVRREAQREALRVYVPPQVADLILSSESAPSLAGTLKEIVVLFADIRNFTRISENLEAQRLVEMLNRFFTEMSRVVFQSGGTVDKFIGDCIMALFGAPVPSENLADQALAAALEMQRSAKAMAIHSNRELSIGIGIHRGPAVVGNVGSSDRVQYTAIGDTVNVAARLVSLAEPGQIIFSEAFRDSLSSVPDALSLGEVELKGRRQNLKLFAINHGTSK